MGWLRSVGSIKLQVAFAEYRLFCRALLQKRPIILSILPTEATQYIHIYMLNKDIHMTMRYQRDLPTSAPTNTCCQEARESERVLFYMYTYDIDTRV